MGFSTDQLLLILMNLLSTAKIAALVNKAILRTITRTGVSRDLVTNILVELARDSMVTDDHLYDAFDILVTTHMRIDDAQIIRLELVNRSIELCRRIERILVNRTYQKYLH